MDTGLMKKAVERYIKALCEHDMGIIEKIFAVNATIEDPAGSEQRVGQEAIQGFYSYAFNNNIRAELTGSVRCADNTAVFPFYVILDRENGQMKLEAIDMFIFNDEGKIQSMKAYWGPENITQL